MDVLSIDLWNTLIMIRKENSTFLTKKLKLRSDLSEEKIISICKSTSKFFDDLAIQTGIETPSIKKLSYLIQNTNSDITALELQNCLKEDLFLHPPIIIDEKGLLLLDNFLNINSIGLIISSNSGYISSSIMREIVSLINLDKLKSFKKSFFSEDIGYAKPSKDFFYSIQKNGYSIITHCGDNKQSDCSIDLPFLQILYSKNQKKAFKGITKIDQLITILADIKKI